MKKKIILFCVVLAQTLYAQPWTYDFGNSTGIHSSSTSTSFLPAPPSGTTYVRIGSQGGTINLENPGLSNLGSNTEIRASASTASSVNKFSIVNYTASKVFSVDFSIVLGNNLGGNVTNNSGGVWSFFLGDGANYSNISTLSITSTSKSQVFVGLRFSFTNNGNLVAAYSDGSLWTEISSISTQGIVHKIKIYGNNTTSTQTYSGGSESIAANKFDIYVDNVKIGDDISKVGIADDANLDSFMFYGESSTSNAANIFIDDIIYSNTLDVVLEAELTHFSAKSENNQSILSWQTANEKDNAFFGIEHATNGNDFREIAQVKGNGTTTQLTDYQYIHTTPSVGANYYRLRQVDFNGTTMHSPIRSVWVSGKGKISLFPTVSSHEITLCTDDTAVNQTYEIYNMLGERVLFGEMQGQKTILISELSRGVYILKIKGENLKFVKE